MIELNDTNFNSVLDALKGSVVIDFWAPWCGPCRMVSPVLERIEKEHDITLIKVNVDESPAIARDYGVMSIPTMVVMREDGFKNVVVGAKPKADLEKAFGLTT